jgi:5'(3')-deoxyribonucleotidase
MAFTVLVDLDSTVYDLLTPTLAWVNKEKGLSLTPKDIKEWQWGKTLGVDLYKFWAREGIFYNLKPFPHAKSALQKVNDWGVRQIFFSTLVDGPFVAWDKIRAIARDFPFMQRDFLLTGKHKDITNGNMLVDDGIHNIEAFKTHGGATVLARFDGVSIPPCASDWCMNDWRQYPEIVALEMHKRG